MNKWDLRFLQAAALISSWSKDPSTKCGAVIVGPSRDIISVGYNGFARGVNDSKERYENRDIKYKMIVHAEENAIVFGDRNRIVGATLYTYPFICCSKCAGIVIQSGIRRCVAPPIPEEKLSRWKENMEMAVAQLQEAGVVVDIVETIGF